MRKEFTLQGGKAGTDPSVSTVHRNIAFYFKNIHPKYQKGQMTGFSGTKTCPFTFNHVPSDKLSTNDLHLLPCNFGRNSLDSRSVSIILHTP